MFVDKSITEFLDQTAEGTPTPGGGSVCALVGALGAALSSMVGEITYNKEDDRNKKLDIQGKIRICKDLAGSLKDGIEEDTEAFNKVMAAYRMPKSTDEEKKARSEAIQEALKEAAETPYETALLCMDVMNMAADMLQRGNKNAASDASVAGLLGYAALNGALYNVKLNLNSIKDNDYVEAIRSKAEELIIESETLLPNIKRLSSEIIG